MFRGSIGGGSGRRGWWWGSISWGGVGEGGVSLVGGASWPRAATRGARTAHRALRAALCAQDGLQDLPGDPNQWMEPACRQKYKAFSDLSNLLRPSPIFFDLLRPSSTFSNLL